MSDDVRDAARGVVDAVELVRRHGTRDFPHGNPTPEEWRRVVERSENLKEKLGAVAAS